MPLVLKGAPVVRKIREKIEKDVAHFTGEGCVPTLAILRVGERADDIYYENSAVKKCNDVGIKAHQIHLPGHADTNAVLMEVRAINREKGIHGALVLRPMPGQVEENAIKEALDPAKDVDCMCDENLFRVFCGDEAGFVPCTPQAVVRLLEHYDIPVEGKEVCIIGRSLVVGKPLSMMLLKRNATVTMCHTRTADLEMVTQRADILIAAAGAMHMVKKNHVKPGAIVVDVGINMDADGKMTGDVDYDAIQEVAGGISPVPGGIGGITSWLLLEHVLDAVKNQRGE
ncbi:bifunctional 5,10-methylenetetrahydrofolate dehydrogenase/5,10-methenyltetrahydrofolate cyclohydrolase [Eubacteriales bacterium OttesenSCG-928-M02]|nr:bifunctional 5,10-methylenetetrahydrofolate dehydrogenase/5,10-methenyltetrahydrofolate cyclohydrolase [Eubacteriales bacterium OttesenSCG-928-M02]